MKNRSLYGKEIDKIKGSTLGEQVYLILKSEIIAGRWSEGEKMPSFGDLSRTTGISQYPLQKTLNRLEAEGFITKIKQKGIFVKSNRPKGASLGVIGLVADEKTYGPYHQGIPKSTQAFGLWDISIIQKHAINLGYQVELIFHSADNSSKDQTSNPASNQKIQGVISLLPRKALKTVQLPPGIPIVYLGVQDPLSIPSVTGNPYSAMYKLTQVLIEKGHRDIAVMVSSKWDSRNLSDAVEGHQDAMREEGLEISHSALRDSSQKAPGDLSGIRDFLEKFSEATAVICLDIDNAIKLVEYADLTALPVPEKLSIGSLQEGYMRRGIGKRFLGAFYDWEAIISTCFEILFGKNTITSKSFSHLAFNPEIEMGDSFRKIKSGTS